MFSLEGNSRAKGKSEGNSRAKGKSGSKSDTLDRKKIASSSGTKQSNGYAIGYEYPSAPNQVFLA